MCCEDSSTVYRALRRAHPSRVTAVAYHSHMIIFWSPKSLVTPYAEWPCMGSHLSARSYQRQATSGAGTLPSSSKAFLNVQVLHFCVHSNLPGEHAMLPMTCSSISPTVQQGSCPKEQPKHLQVNCKSACVSRLHLV
jgi:hypothetical protein